MKKRIITLVTMIIMLAPVLSYAMNWNIVETLELSRGQINQIKTQRQEIIKANEGLRKSLFKENKELYMELMSETPSKPRVKAKKETINRYQKQILQNRIKSIEELRIILSVEQRRELYRLLQDSSFRRKYSLNDEFEIKHLLIVLGRDFHNQRPARRMVCAPVRPVKYHAHKYVKQLPPRRKMHQRQRHNTRRGHGRIVYKSRRSNKRSDFRTGLQIKLRFDNGRVCVRL
ncbi:Spy/CpxP family protein refolding chaperone [Thermoproteota archaeon]